MKTISDGPIEMHGYELRGCRQGARAGKEFETYDKSNRHPKPLEQISQYPDRKRVRVGGISNFERIEGYSSHKHLKPAQPCGAYGSSRIMLTRGKTRNAPVMAKERSRNDFPQPNQTKVIEPETRTASARYDLNGVQPVGLFRNRTLANHQNSPWKAFVSIAPSLSA